MRSSRAFGAATVAAVCIACGACVGAKAPAGPAPSPGEAYRRLLGVNEGVNSLRAVVEARLSYAGGRVALPGVLLLDALGGFRLDLLDPLDRPVAMIYSEGGRIVQYRPGRGVAASLGVFPGECRGVAPDDWVPAVLASSVAPAEGERLVVSSLWGDRVLERWREGVLRQSVRFYEEAGGLLPRSSTWFCGGEPVMALKFKGAVGSGGRRVPASLELCYLKAGLTVELQLREVEANPSLAGAPVRPRLADGTNWMSWRLP